VPATFSQLITISPAVVYSTELTEDGLIISSEQFSMPNSYQKAGDADEEYKQN
jgi:hypothetical protein